MEEDWAFDGVMLKNEMKEVLGEEDDPPEGEGSLDEGDDPSGDDDYVPPRRRRIPFEAVPPLPEHLFPTVLALAADFAEETKGSERFETDSREDMLRAAGIFARYRLPPLAAIRQTDRDARRMFVSDLRDIERLAFPDIRLMISLISHFTPQLLKAKANAKGPPFGEAVLPGKLRKYTADLSQLGAFLKPNQLMAKRKELARGKLQVPSYTPYIVSDVSPVPRPVPTAEHTAAATRWTSNRQASKAVIQQNVSFNACLLYRIRFILTSDLLGAWRDFGGLSAQLNHVSILLHMVTTEATTTALVYDGLISSHLEELARPRANKTAGAVDFHDLLSNEHARFKLQAVAQAKPGAANAGLAKKEKAEKAAKGAACKDKHNRIWLPKKEYLANLSDEKALSGQTATSSDVKPSKPSLHVLENEADPVADPAALLLNAVALQPTRKELLKDKRDEISLSPLPLWRV